MDNIKRTISYILYKHIPKKLYPYVLKNWFKRNTGYPLDLDNPKTYSEKIQWLKLYDSTPYKAMLSDKYAVREWIKERIGEEYLVPLLGVWDRAEDIDFDSLPDSFVLKTNHSSSWNIIVKDKKDLDIAAARKQLNKWLKLDFTYYCGLQLHYKFIKPRIVAEKYLENTDGLDDYKFMCFDGKPCFIWKDTGRFGQQHYRTIYDLDWNILNFEYEYPRLQEAEEPPVSLKEMTELAKELCKEFPHVRVDFYEVDGRPLFGEMTFTCSSGLDVFRPHEMDYTVGELLDLSKIEKTDYMNI